jgi:hypothetical protein
MTIMHINVPDDLAEAFPKAFPGESLELAFERWLRAEVARREQIKPRAKAIMEAFRSIREASTPITDGEIRALRHEGRR